LNSDECARIYCLHTNLYLHYWLKTFRIFHSTDHCRSRSRFDSHPYWVLPISNQLLRRCKVCFV